MILAYMTSSSSSASRSQCCSWAESAFAIANNHWLSTPPSCKRARLIPAVLLAWQNWAR